MPFNPTEDMISMTPQSDIKSIDDVLVGVFEKHGMPRLGGASGRGWSSYSTFMRCPYLYKIKYVDGIKGGSALALETGSAFHTFMALYYTWMVDESLTLTPEVCREALIDGGARAEAVIAGWRIFDAYQMHYETDYLMPLAVEQFAEGDNGNTCRFDMIARIDTPQPGIVPGTYIIEHKSASRFTSDLIEGWHNDGEVLGQIMVWKQAGLDKKYGKLMGNIVNIVGKQKIPQFHRTIVPAQAWHVKSHTEDLALWRAYQEMCRATNTWPKARNNCVGRYGMCEMFHHCSTNQKLTPIKQLKNNTIKARRRRAKNVIADGTETTSEMVPAAIDTTETLASDDGASENANDAIMTNGVSDAAIETDATL